jgi:hypothetical protein
VGSEFLKVSLVEGLLFLLLAFRKIKISLYLFLGLHPPAETLLLNQPVVLVEHPIQDLRVLCVIFQNRNTRNSPSLYYDSKLITVGSRRICAIRSYELGLFFFGHKRLMRGVRCNFRELCVLFSEMVEVRKSQIRDECGLFPLLFSF